ncbi:transformation/transcription domain-associated protein [Strongylocentrotus purpuratus]|uniref:Transformation/transcription domain-associated protein n=1 Tax=Strongylocentrotus purpuratus TaxID=7668 RepID=A0A7M7P4L8_STRPU|nr:transformation/transcription domain-associated protein [Strongylocentrotus purpuratus]
MPVPTGSSDPTSVMNKYRNNVTVLADSRSSDETRLKAAQEISENFEVIISSSQYHSFLETAIPHFLKVLKDEKPQFIAESPLQHLRKLLLELLHRMPTNEQLRTFVRQILELMFILLEAENEENVLVCLKIIIELHKYYRPTMQPEVQHFLQFVKSVYKDIQVNMKTYFLDVIPGTPAPDPMNIQLFVDKAGFSCQTIITIQQADGQKVQQTILPKGVNSLKVLAEYPIIVVLMYQLYKQNVHNVVADFIPLVMNTIGLQPTQQARASPNFNKEMYVDFIAAQIKTLSFLAYIIKIYQDLVNSYAPQMVKGMLGLFGNCPSEVAHLRKELLIAARHILGTDLRNKFVPSIDKLFEEHVLVGSGWTSKESLRPLAYSTLADLVHHVRQQLPLQHLSMAVHLFSKNVHDESLPCNIQTMSCKLLLNLVECIRQKSEQDGANAREILMRMLEVFVLKFHTIADNQLPVIFDKCRQQQEAAQEKMLPPVSRSISVSSATASSSTTTTTTTTTSSSTASVSLPPPPPTPTTPQTMSFASLSTTAATIPPATPTTPAPPVTPGVSSITTAPLSSLFPTREKDESKPKKYLPTGLTHFNNYSVVDCRSLVKTVVCGVKTITWGVSACKVSTDPNQNKQFHPKETAVFIKLVKHALKALDIYQIQISPTGQTSIRAANTQSVRLKEEKEVLEHFAGVFNMMHPLTFREIFQTTIEYMVERIYKNYALQLIANSFLANLTTSATFATILVEYLLERMEEMGTNQERSNLYLKLFKLVFGSVSLFANENEQMLKPHLHKIVNRSMELATTAKDPYNYFLLLRALFRSIGGGSHDLLYQEFLPLLPNLLQGLNQLQSGLHKQHMKDLFVELCLTVPVRLSSLLPYLPMLMDPLVSALNGSQTLVSQGLRTLELCVDNLQPDFLYEHIQPVRAELMQALWRTLRNRSDQIARVAFRVLGKLGGGNRKMLREPQRLTYEDDENDGPCITILFPDHKTPVHLPVSKVIETALSKLTSPTTDVFYRRQAWEVIRHFIVSMLSLGDEQRTIQQLLFHTSFHDGEIPRTTSHAYKCHDHLSRICFQNALTSMIVSATIKDLRPSSLPFMMNVVRHITLVAVAQQAGPLPTAHSRQKSLNDNMDPHVLIDAISACMAHEEKELCKTGQLAMTVIVETAAAVMGSKARACSLSIFEYVADRMCNCCYERAWYAKLGGCIAIKFMMENMDMCWVQSHLYLFLKALLFVMMDLTKEVSSGALNMAKSNVDLVLKLCATPPTGADAENPKLAVAQQKAFHDVTRELVREVTSPNQTVREQAMDSLRWLADFTDKKVMEIMSPHKEVLADMIPPKKHLLRHQPANAQRGLMDSNTFCTTLEPRLFTMDPTIPEHKVFFTELMNLCETEDSGLVKLPCYKAVPSLVPLRISALNALAACRYIPQARERIFKILFNALNSNVSELQEAGAKCMEKFIAGQPVEMELVHTSVRPLLLMLGDHRTLNLNVIQRLHSLTQLFPNAFNEKLCEQMLGHLKKWLETTVISQKNGQKSTDSLKICTAILNIFHAIPAASAKILEHLLTLVIKAEGALTMEVGSPFREPLLKYLLRYAQQTVDLFLQENNLKNHQLSRMFNYLLKHELAEPLRSAIQKNPSKLINLAFSKSQPPARPTNTAEKFLLELQYQSIRICATMVKHDKEWLPQTPTVFVHLRRIWVSDAFQERHRHDNQGVSHWEEPKLLVKCLLNYAKQHPSNVELLFQLLRVFSNRYLPNFQFFRTFLEETVAQGYSVEQKRHIFFKFVELFHDKSFPQELKAKALQYVIIPMFAASFDKGEGDSLIGGPPNPGQDSPDNLVSVFISKVIDPENPYGTSDSVRILLLQFAALLVERAAPHIHDAADKKQGTKLRRLMTFAWPCLIQKNCVDPTTKYHGHLLLAHNIAKFAIHKRIVLQVFHSLLKAHAAEARSVVRQALDILTPVLPQRMEDGNAMLTHWTKKIIVEEGYTIAQLVHMLQLLVRHYKVYYPVRHHLIQTMVYSIQRLGNTPNATLEHRKLVVELVEVIIKWEVQRIREDEGTAEPATPVEEPPVVAAAPAAPAGVKRSASTDLLPDPKRVRHTSSGSTVRSITSEASKPIEKVYSDAVVNFLIRLACQVNDSSSTTTVSSPGEQLSRRCMALLKTALRPDVWPNSELRLNFLDKLFLSVAKDTQAVANYGNICAGLDVLNFLLGVMDKPTILSSFKPLQRGIAACMTCPSTKVIRSVHALLVKLMSTFPTESSTSNVASKYEELDSLYASVGKVIYEGLTAYEKATNGSPTSSLFGTLMILKAACTNNISYIDRLITVFMRALQKMAKEHLSPSSTDATSLASELLIISLDLVKNRVGVMSTDMRRNFVQVLTSVIEKSPDAKVLKTIVKMVEEWVKAKTPLMLNQSPSPREKTILLVKLMQYVEKRFPDESELNAQFLELVNWVYRDDSLAGSELTSKLEPAFLSGLRCSQPHIRTKFFEVFNSSIRRRLFDRLLYLIDSQNWEAMGSHYWLKQCVELLMASSATSTLISNINTSPLPCITSVINLADSQEKAAFMLAAHVKEEPMDVESDLHKEEDVEIDIELPQTDGGSSSSSTGPSSEPRQQLQQLINRDIKFLESLRNVKTFTFLHAVSQLCHSDTDLTHSFWVHLFPKVWKILSEKEQTTLSQEVSPFLCSGSHHYQKDAPMSTIHTFVEAVSRCSPPITIRPCVLKYLGKSHNLWHRCILMLEQNAITSGFSSHHRPRTTSVYDFFEPDNTAAMQQETLDSLSELYERLEEEDLWAGLWQRRCKFPETATALSYEQQGFFEQAQTTYEQALAKARSEHNSGPASNMLFPEYHLWESHWVRCCKELSQWDILMEYGNTKGHTNPQLVLESAWRVPNWGAMKEALAQVEQSCPREMNWKVNLYRGFIAICHPDEKNLTLIERLVEMSSKQALEEWRRLPHYVTQAHTPLLQASQRIMELQEASQVHHGLQPTNLGRNQSLHDMKAIVKTWRNRLPMVSDDLSHWSDIFMWRQHHYQAIVQAYDNSSSTTQDNQQHNHTMLGVHASAQSIINYGKVARKHSLIGPALDSLSRIHTIPSVPVVDCFQKIRQQVKCYLQMAGTMGKQELQEGLEVIESTNLKYFSREMTAEFYALKGMFLAQVGRSDEANKTFSAAVQMHDTLVKAWALWGDYLEQIFCKDKQMSLGESAITCFLHACRHQNESKSRKYLAKVLWLITYDDEKADHPLAKAVDKYSVGVPPIQWLPWIPQLLTCLVGNEGDLIINILMQVGRVYPQALYFPIRTLYLTHKIEHREKFKSGDASAGRRRLSSTVIPTKTLTAADTTTPSDATPSNTATVSKEDTKEDIDAKKETSSTTTTTAATTAAGGDATTSTTTPSTTSTTSDSTSTTTTTTTPSTSTPAPGLGASVTNPGPIRASVPMVRCSKIMGVQRDLHPILLSSLEGIVDQMVWFRENWYEEVLRHLRLALAKCQAVAFENRGAVVEAKVTPHTLSFVKKLVNTFGGVGIENVSSVTQTLSSAASELLVRRAQATAQDPIFQKLKNQFKIDFDFSQPGATKLRNLIAMLKKWIKIIETRTKLLPKSFLIEERCRFLSHFSSATADVELPGEFLTPKHSHYTIRIARFMPHVEITHKHNTAARRLYIRGSNGKIYPYLVVNDASMAESRREERVLQVLRMLNHYLGKRKETAKRQLQFTVPRVVAVSPQMRLVEDSPSSLSLLDIYKKWCSKQQVETDPPINRYYERLAVVQLRGSQASHQVLRDILKEVQTNMVPRTLLKEWALDTFPTSTDYFAFRKMMCGQLALLGLAEFVLHLTRLNPEIIQIERNSGLLSVFYFRFDLDETSGELDANRPVPFRLTPNIAEFLTTVGVNGMLNACMISIARCLVQPSFQLPAILKAVLRDEMIAWSKKKQEDTSSSSSSSSSSTASTSSSQQTPSESELLITLVTKAINAIMTRLQNLAQFEGGESKVSTLVAAANSPDNLCRMDPAWHPWL